MSLSDWRDVSWCFCRGALLLPMILYCAQSARWFIAGLGFPKLALRSKPSFSARHFFLLCFSESFSMVAVAYILWDNGTLSAQAAIIVAMCINALGYCKYLYQMFVDPEYITLSFHAYNAAWCWVSVVYWDPLYYLLFRYPFSALIAVENYIDLKGRKVLFDNLGLTVHSVDHLLHGIISLRVLLYHTWGMWALTADIAIVPFVTLLSDSLVKVQMRTSEDDMACAASAKKGE